MKVTPFGPNDTSETHHDNQQEVDQVIIDYKSNKKVVHQKCHSLLIIISVISIVYWHENHNKGVLTDQCTKGPFIKDVINRGGGGFARR